MPYLGTDPAITVTGGGKVLQVVFSEVTGSSQITITTGSYTWTDNVSCNITPASTDNKVFITGAMSVCNASASQYCNGTIFRDSIGLADATFGLAGGTVNTHGFNVSPWSCSYLDSPSSTSEITYKLRGAIQSNGTGYLNVNDAHASMVLMEIEG